MIKRSFDIPSVEVDVNILRKVYDIFKKDFPKIDSFYISITLETSEGEISFASFEELFNFGGVFPDKIKTMRIYISSHNNALFTVMRLNRGLGSSSCEIGTQEQSKTSELYFKIKDLFNSNKPIHFWLYTLWGIPLYTITLLSSLFGTALIVKYLYLNPPDVFTSGSVYLLGATFLFMLNRLFPRTVFTLKKIKYNGIKVVRIILVILLGSIIGSGIYELIKRAF